MPFLYKSPRTPPFSSVDSWDPFLDIIDGFLPDLRPEAGAGRPWEAVRCEQDVGSKLADAGQREDGLCGPGFSVSSRHPAEQRAGQRLRQPDG